MSYQKQRENFIIGMCREIGSVGWAERIIFARLILRHSQSLQTIAERYCNEELNSDGTPSEIDRSSGVLTDRMTDSVYASVKKREEMLMRRINELCQPYGIVPIFDGDPRGAVVKLKVPSGRTDDWSKQGICVPTRG